MRRPEPATLVPPPRFVIPRKPTVRALIALLAAAGVLLRAAIPVGYMPGDLSRGAWAAPCPSGFPAGWFEASGAGGAHGGHAHHHPPSHGADGDASVHDPETHAVALDERCPLGEALHAPALPVHPTFVSTALTTAPPPVGLNALIAARRPPGLPDARAPPLS